MNQTKILLFSDLHSSKKAFQKLKKFLEDKSFDFIIFTGDFTNTWKEDVKFVKKILDFFKEKKIKFLAIPGNNDKQEILDLLEKYHANIHLKMQKNSGLEFYGIGGLGDPEEYKIKNLRAYKINPKTIFVSHIPPNFQLVKKVKILPLIHIFGHRHFLQKPKTIKNCLFIQIPSILKSQIVILELPKKKVKFIKI